MDGGRERWREYGREEGRGGGRKGGREGGKEGGRTRLRGRTQLMVHELVRILLFLSSLGVVQEKMRAGRRSGEEGA